MFVYVFFRWIVRRHFQLGLPCTMNHYIRNWILHKLDYIYEKQTLGESNVVHEIDYILMDFDEAGLLKSPEPQLFIAPQSPNSVNN